MLPGLRGLLRQVDARDLVFGLAMALVFTGLLFVYWPAALIVTGALLFALALAPEFRGRRQRR